MCFRYLRCETTTNKKALGRRGTDGSPSPKKQRLDEQDKTGVVMDCVIGDNTGPLMATFWNECAVQLQKLIQDHGVGVTFLIAGLKITDLKEDNYNGKSITRIRALSNLPHCRTEKKNTTLTRVVGVMAEPPNLSTMPYEVPPKEIVIDTFSTLSSVSVPFRTCLKGFVIDRSGDTTVLKEDALCVISVCWIGEVLTFNVLLMIVTLTIRRSRTGTKLFCTLVLAAAALGLDRVRFICTTILLS